MSALAMWGLAVGILVAGGSGVALILSSRDLETAWPELVIDKRRPGDRPINGIGGSIDARPLRSARSPILDVSRKQEEPEHSPAAWLGHEGAPQPDAASVLATPAGPVLVLDRQQQSTSRTEEPRFGAPPMLPMLEDLAPYLERFASDHRATIGQASAVQKIGIIGDTARFSFEQASIILRCRRYGARVIHDLAGEIDGSPEEQRVVEAALTAFIVKDEHLRARATEGYSSDAARKSSKLPQSDQDSDRVKSEARRLLLTLKLAREEG